MNLWVVVHFDKLSAGSHLTMTMINIYHVKFKMNHLRRYKWLYALVVYGLALIILRIKLTGNTYFSFFFLNVALALIPFRLSFFLGKSHNLRSRIIFCIAILFLPNAPYLFTDLTHLFVRSDVPIRYDTFFHGIFAFVGLVLYHQIVRGVVKFLNISSRRTMLFVFFISMLSGVGIYIGRFLRFHSIHFFTDPFELFRAMREAMVVGPEIGEFRGYTMMMTLTLFLVTYAIQDREII